MRFWFAAAAAALLQGCSPLLRPDDPVPPGHVIQSGLIGERYVVSPTTQRFNRCMGGATQGGISGAGAEALLILPLYLLGASAVCGIVAETDRPTTTSVERSPATSPVPVTGSAPKCADVGGYEAYKARTGEVCRL